MKDTIGYLEKRNKELTDKVIEQDVLIKKMRDVLRFCARTNVGSYYQQESAKAMLLNNEPMIWSRFNPDGTYNEEHRTWILLFGGGQEELDLIDEEERSLLQIK